MSRLWLLPMLLLYGIFILGGFFLVFVESLGHVPALGLREVSFSAYGALLSDIKTFQSMGYALFLAVTASAISSVLGVWVAYRLLLSPSIRGTRFYKGLLRMGVILPYLYMAFLTTLLLSRTGILSRVLYHLRVIDGLEQFPNLLYGGMGWGVILIFVLKGFPFVALYVLGVMENVQKTHQSVAMTLGASEVQRLRYIFLPICAIVWSTVVLFVYDLGAFEIPFLFLGQAKAPLSVRLYSAYIDPNIMNLPRGMALAVLLFLLGAVGAFLYALVIKKVIVWQSKW